MSAIASKHGAYESPRPSSVWLTAFSDEDRVQQLHDDSVAWSRVSGVLMVVITLGLLIAIVAVLTVQTLP